ncbi:Dolichyl-phosphate-mannose-protein mannosyltransferase 2 [Smittium culicis]|uniref:Dolichyl-phosphate-mannose--protein mannosyltransferase n=1 Tax=Smittium culicis TaxID=133412 RepID=A0A1R1XUR3_9FUNG|nr:Dolichyl-phosphate-mannose-protein mannosyltransferase 2 [Smittium culicis]
MFEDNLSAKRRNKSFSPAQIILPQNQSIELESIDINSDKKKKYLPNNSSFSSLSDSFPKASSFSVDNLIKRSSHLFSSSVYSSKKFIHDNKIDVIIVVLLTIAGLFTRIYKIGISNKVTWDEAHFGKFGAFYINRTFYHDVHPPLAKMLVALAEVIAGHNGTFDFPSGNEYPSYVNYVSMRIQLALYGILLIPLAYVTCKSLHMSRNTSTLAALFILFDNALCVMSKFILLDQPLLFFPALSIMCFAKFGQYRRQAFTNKWFLWLALTGVSLGFVLSSKWIGLFCVATVGLSTVMHLWEMYGQLKMPLEYYLNHWAARIVCLIFIPLVIYLLTFVVHFGILNRAGSGDERLSTKFQAGQIGHRLNTQPIDVADNSTARLRSYYSRSGLLHSHNHTYPTNSIQYQATTFQGKDFNNEWLLYLDAESQLKKTDPTSKIFEDGDFMRLVHKNSSRVLRTISQEAPITPSDLMVSTYDNSKETDLDKSDLWKIEIFKQTGPLKDNKIHPIITKFVLRNVKYDCLLRTKPRHLPSWGWNQREVSCTKIKKSDYSDEVFWNVEEHTNTALKNGNMGKYVSSFLLFDIVQLNIEMANSNNALVPDQDKYNQLESTPEMWPFLYRPMRMVGWGDTEIKYYEIGNPILWWLSSFAILLFPFQILVCSILYSRFLSAKKHGKTTIPLPQPNMSNIIDSPMTGLPAGYSTISNSSNSFSIEIGGSALYKLVNDKNYWIGAYLLWSGWAFHYLPFFLMGRVTYLHHYLPALYFALLFLAYQIDYLTKFSFRSNKVALNRIVVVLALASMIVFIYFFPFTVGYNKPAKDLKGRVWRSSWNVYEDPFEI